MSGCHRHGRPRLHLSREGVPGGGLRSASRRRRMALDYLRSIATEGGERAALRVVSDELPVAVAAG